MSEQLETTTQETTEQVEAPQQEDANTPQIETQEAAAQETPEWQPNYKYKYRGEEKEIDDPYFRSVIKDPDSEKKFRDLYERAEATSFYKQDFYDIRKKYEDIAPKYQELDSQLKKIATVYEKGDMDLFFKGLGVDEKKVFEWVAKKLQYEQLPEDQKRLYDENRDARVRSLGMEEELAYHREQAAKEAVNARSFQLERELGKADVQSIASEYDAIYGNGSFEKEVVRAGQFEWLTNKRDISAVEAVQMVVGKVKPIVERLQSAGTPANPSMPKPKVITNLAASSNMPAKRRITSIEDLKKLAAQQ